MLSANQIVGFFKMYKKEMNDEVYFWENVKVMTDFLPADIREGFLQTSTMILGVCGQACQK